MKITRFTSALFIILLSSGCGPSAEEKAAKEKEYQTTIQDAASNSNNGAGSNDQTDAAKVSTVASTDLKETNKDNGPEFISSSAAVEDKKDTIHKFIRTADLKFKVVDVIHATYDIENIAKLQEGFVTYTNLVSHIDYTDNTIVSADSTLETVYYTVNNTIILRVPNTNLDTTLKLIAKNIDFLDYRLIKAEDVALDLYANVLRQKRAEKNEQRLIKAIDERGKKLNETTHAEEMVYNRQEQADETKISTMRIQDQINFSTINLTIYQRQTIKRELVANTKNITAYEPGLGHRLKEAARWGWDSLQSFVVSLVKLWGIILVIVIIYLLFRRYKNRK